MNEHKPFTPEEIKLINERWRQKAIDEARLNSYDAHDKFIAARKRAERLRAKLETAEENASRVFAELLTAQAKAFAVATGEA